MISREQRAKIAAMLRADADEIEGCDKRNEVADWHYSPELLRKFAMLIEHEKVGECEHCGKLFAAQRSSRRYCSNSCRVMDSMRRKKDADL